MKRILITSSLFIIVFSVAAQNRTADSLKSLLAQTKKPIARFDLLNQLMVAYYTGGGGMPDSSIVLEMLKIAEQTKNDSLLAIAYNIVGGIFASNNGNYDKGLEYYFKGVPLAEKVKDKRRISSLYIDIAQVYLRMNNSADQIKYLRKAWENLPDKNSPLYSFMLAQTELWLCRYFISQHENDSALHYAQALKETNLRLKSGVYETAAQAMLGTVYNSFGDKALAGSYFKRSIEILDSIQFVDAFFLIDPMYIEFLLQNNNLSTAKIEAIELMNIGSQNYNYDMKRLGAGYLRKIFDLEHKTDSAYYYSRLESEIKDSLFSQDHLNRIRSLEFSEQLREAEEERQRALEEERRKANLQYALLALAIVTFVMGFLLLSHRVITNVRVIQFLSVVALLLVFEFLNLLIHPTLEKITNHSPVWMLLALVCIAAILVPMHHKLEKLATHKLVEKNKQVRMLAARKKS